MIRFKESVDTVVSRGKAAPLRMLMFEKQADNPMVPDKIINIRDFIFISDAYSGYQWFFRDSPDLRAEISTPTFSSARIGDLKYADLTGSSKYAPI